MDVAFLKYIIRDSKTLGAGAHHRTRRLYRFLHDIAQRACHRRLSLAWQNNRLNGQQLAAHFRPRQSGHLTNLVFTLGHTEGIATHTEKFIEIARGYGNAFLVFSEQQRFNYFAADF